MAALRLYQHPIYTDFTGVSCFGMKPVVVSENGTTKNLHGVFGCWSGCDPVQIKPYSSFLKTSSGLTIPAAHKENFPSSKIPVIFASVYKIEYGNGEKTTDDFRKNVSFYCSEFTLSLLP
jgi:hypothetical protein